MPIKRRDIVKARILSVISLELLQIAVAVPFAIINQRLYATDNFLMDPNMAFFGFIFIMYALFNVVFFPMFYKSGYKIGIPAIAAIIVSVLYATAVELLVLFVPVLHTAFDGSSPDTFVTRLLLLSAGILIFLVSSVWTYKTSAKRFEKLDL